jgi:hypothetical protein
MFTIVCVCECECVCVSACVCDAGCSRLAAFMSLCRGRRRRERRRRHRCRWWGPHYRGPAQVLGVWRDLGRRCHGPGEHNRCCTETNKAEKCYADRSKKTRPQCVCLLRDGKKQRSCRRCLGEFLCQAGTISRVGTVFLRYFWQSNHRIYGHIRCIYTVLANPSYLEVETPRFGITAPSQTSAYTQWLHFAPIAM